MRLGRLRSQIVLVLGQRFLHVLLAPHPNGIAFCAVVRDLEQVTFLRDFECRFLRTAMRVAKTVRIILEHVFFSCYHQNMILGVLYQIKKKIVKFLYKKAAGLNPAAASNNRCLSSACRFVRRFAQ